MEDSPTSRLVSLPKELLFRVRSHLHSLQDHVNFSLSSATFNQLYDKTFWEFACRVSGWGMRKLTPSQKKLIEKPEEHDKLWPWSGLARNVVKDAPAMAAFPSIASLVQRESIYEHDQPNLALWTAKSPEEIKASRAQVQMVDLPEISESNSIKAKKRFVIGPGNWTRNDRWVEFRDPEENKPSPPLVGHPIVANMFVTFPPVTRVALDKGEDTVYDEFDMIMLMNEMDFDDRPRPRFLLENPGGLTTSDLYLSFAQILLKFGYPDSGPTFRSMCLFDGFYNEGCLFKANWGSYMVMH